MGLTVINWNAARRLRKSLRELVLAELTDRPTLLAIVSEMYTQEHHLRPFMPLAERFAGRMEILLCAEWPQEAREKDGEPMLAALGLAPEARPRLLRDEGDVRVGVVLRAKQPVALIGLYFAERAPTSPLYADDGREALFAAREERVALELSQLLTRLPAQPPPPAPAPLLKAGEHDFNRGGVCRLCADGPMSRRPCPGTQSLARAEEKARDRFELIELE